MNEALENFDWSVTTWEGSRREQLRRWAKLSFREKMEALEKMGDLALKILAHHKKRGLPYFDPYTGQLVHPATTP